MNRVTIAIAATFAVLAGGCIEREMSITSEPAGALVFISDVEKGRTPLTVSFTWYGDYDLILRREGYKTLKTHAHINAPAHQYPPLDLFVAMAPWTVRDHRYLHFRMEELVQPTDEQLIERAETLRKRNLQPVTR